ncbi:tetratricopeptide repeat protein [Algibacter sp. R77976]|uniref:tetratricopeptide repeat protein n=1 Tax=Algibacter sp. R77976 TaxID=3093873 RepID=UPI0037C593D6
MKIFNKSVFVFVLIVFFFSCKQKESKYTGKSEVIENVFKSTKLIPDNHFLGDQKCKSCHEDEFELWQGSHHDKAMQIVSDSTILGDFNNTKFKSQGVTSHFFKKDDDFYVNTEGPDGTYEDYKIEYVFGVKPLQQYIVQFPNGHYQCLRTAWDTKKNTWFDLYPNFKVVHSEWLHWSRGGLNWNTMCSDCHSTNVRKNYDFETHSYDTKYAIINVSCEACHGPGKDHVEEVNRLGGEYKPSGHLKMVSISDSKKLVDECARCHMRREQVTDHFNFEGSMLDHYFPQLIEENLYYPDGQILDEVYVYGSFVQSKMYHNGVSCINCHDSHSLQLKFQDNQLCTQCHLPDSYNTPSHHFHKENSEGSKCIECHMTGRFYMGNDYRRDHSFRIPRPDLSLKYGSPNACTECHDDKDNEWAWEQFKNYYGEPDNKHFSELLAPGIVGEENGLKDLLELANDSIYPEIARASAVKTMNNYLDATSIDKMISFLNDDSPLVRGASLDVLGELNAQDYIEYALPLLEDEKRSIRVKAFYVLASLDEIQIPETYKEAYGKVKKEFDTNLKATADFVGGRIKKANYALRKGDLNTAIQGYESALEIDNLNNIIRTNLANLYYQNKDFKNAELAFKTIIKQEPKFGQTYYSYGLLLAELNRYGEAILQMQEAIKLMPENTRIYYNISLLYNKLNDLKNAEAYVLKGLKIEANNESLLYMLAYLYSKSNKTEQAKTAINKLIQLYPGNTNYQNFLNQLNNRS